MRSLVKTMLALSLLGIAFFITGDAHAAETNVKTLIVTGFDVGRTTGRSRAGRSMRSWKNRDASM